MDDKVIVTHAGALTAKYGARGRNAVVAAVKRLVAADAGRGIKTRLVALDDGAAMRRLHAPAVADAASPRQFKEAIDALHRRLQPDYLLLLGSRDVIPHQPLSNPVYQPPDDDDPHAWGDLPYACDAPYSVDPARFVGPTRVVGRLPGLTGADEPSHLIRLLDRARRYTSRPPQDYAKYFGLSAKVWARSTAASLFVVFGNSSKLRPSPPRGPSHPPSVLAARSHFVNCHGGTTDPRFYGQSGRRFPTALTSRGVRNKIREGTLAAVECCYGAELYDSFALDLDPPICQRYLGQGAYAWAGSTTIAYGPAEGNGAADLIAQYFLKEVLAGASIGRAMLSARQRFVADAAEMDPVDLKTLAQFCLLGDPSVHPVRPDRATRLPRATDAHAARRAARRARRLKLRDAGRFLLSTKPTAFRRAAAPRSRSMLGVLAGIAADAGLSRRTPFRTFTVRRGAQPPPAVASRYHLAIATHGEKSTRVVLAKEVAGRVVGYRVYERR